MPPPVDPPSDPSGPGERIAKLLARAGVASRREVERMVADGRVARHGVVLDTPATVLASLDGVTVDGTPVAQAAPARLFLYHKPVGLLVTERDPRGRPTIYDRLPTDLPRLVPVGRLDLATEGLLLLTTDGGLKRQLELPATGVERAYRARAYGQVTQTQLEALIEGVEIEGVRYGSINANLERRTGANVWIELVLTEGKNREVRRVLEYLGLQVSRLIRTRYGPFVLGDLPPGEIGEVRQVDLMNFRQSLGARRNDETRIAIPPREAVPNQTRRQPRAAHADSPRVDRSRANAPAMHRPGKGRDPVATGPERQPHPSASPGRPAAPTRTGGAARAPASTGLPFKWRGERPSASPAQPNAGRRTNAAPAPKPRAAAPSRTPDPVPGKAPVSNPSDATPRPARPQRKSGWAKPKPKSGPARPRRPR